MKLLEIFKDEPFRNKGEELEHIEAQIRDLYDRYDHIENADESEINQKKIQRLELMAAELREIMFASWNRGNRNRIMSDLKKMKKDEIK